MPTYNPKNVAIPNLTGGMAAMVASMNSRNRSGQDLITALDDTVKKRTLEQSTNIASAKEGTTADLINQIRDGKTPDTTGLMYNGQKVGDAEFEYDKWRSTENRLNTREARIAGNAMDPKDVSGAALIMDQMAQLRNLGTPESLSEYQALRTDLVTKYPKAAMSFSKSANIFGDSINKNIADDAALKKDDADFAGILEGLGIDNPAPVTDKPISALDNVIGAPEVGTEAYAKNFIGQADANPIAESPYEAVASSGGAIPLVPKNQSPHAKAATVVDNVIQNQSKKANATLLTQAKNTNIQQQQDYDAVGALDATLDKLYTARAGASPRNQVKLDGLIKQYESKRTALGTKITRADKTLKNIQNKHTKNIKDETNAYKEKQTNKLNSLIAKENNPKDRMDVLNKYIKEEQAGTNPLDQHLRDALFDVQAKIMSAPSMKWDKDRPSERNSYNISEGKIVSTTAGLEREPFFKDFRDDSVDQILDIAEDALEYSGGKLNLAVLEQAIKQTRGGMYGFDRNDKFWGGEDGGANQGIDNQKFLYSETEFKNDVKENYLEVYNRAMTSGLLDAKSRSTKARAKRMSEKYENLKGKGSKVAPSLQIPELGPDATPEEIARHIYNSRG